jgi:hypothetical protein
VDRGAAGFDETKFEWDSAQCHAYPLVLPIAFGVEGAALCVIHAPPTGGLLALTITAAVCGTAGFGRGAYKVIDDYDGWVEKCLGEEGYWIRR